MFDWKLMSIRRILFSTLTTILCLLFYVTSATSQPSRESEYVRRDAGRYRIVFCPDDERVIESLLQELNARIPAVEQFIGASLGDTVKFVITPTESEWNRVTAGAPLWAHGIAIPGQGTAILKSPRFGLPYGPLPTTAVHEYVHILLSAVTKDRGLPRWFDEGTAQFAAGQLDFLDHAVVSRAAGARRLHSFQNLQGLMGMSALEAKQGYAESLLAVQLLHSKYGWSGISNLLHSMRSGLDFEEAFAQIFGLTTVAFEREFHADINAHFGTSLLADTELWVSALFVVLVFASGIIIYRKRKRTLARWEEDEQKHILTDTLTVAPPYTVNYEQLRSRRDDAEPNLPTDRGGESRSNRSGESPDSPRI